MVIEETSFSGQTLFRPFLVFILSCFVMFMICHIAACFIAWHLTTTILWVACNELEELGGFVIRIWFVLDGECLWPKLTSGNKLVSWSDLDCTDSRIQVCFSACKFKFGVILAYHVVFSPVRRRGLWLMVLNRRRNKATKRDRVQEYAMLSYATLKVTLFPSIDL